MQYTKPSLTPDQQADLLILRGLSGDRAQIVERLHSVSYYRLSGYWYPFRKPDDGFLPGTTFETVWRRYVFDRRLRLVVMDAVERIEVAVRTQLALHHSMLYGPFAYAEDPLSLPGMDPRRRTEFLGKLQEELDRGRETFLLHFKSKYGDTHSTLPIWMAAEVMTMGSTLSLYKGCPRKVKTKVATLFSVPDEVLGSWLLCLNTVRNICAHHSRLWNREFGIKPLIPRLPKYPEWHSPVAIPNHRVFAVLSICNHCLSEIAPQSGWKERLFELQAQYPEIPLRDMGFPEGWQSSPIWN